MSQQRVSLQSQLKKGIELFRSDRYSEAAQQFEVVRKASIAAHVGDLAARATGDIGSTQFALHQYQPALSSFLDAQRLAAAANDPGAAAAFGVNIASLYSEMGALDAATQWIQGSLEKMSPSDRREQTPKVLIQMATLKARQNRMPEAVRMFGEGVDAAERAGYAELSAIGWNRTGEEFLKRGELAAAEPALLEAYRIRKLNHLALDSSYRNLGRLRLEQGDLESASMLLDRAVDLTARPQGPIPSWDVYHYRGRVRLAQGRLRDSVDDLRISVRLARDWRWSVPSDDASRIGAEGWLQMVHSAMVEAGNRLYLETRDPALIRETLEVAEENRASSLRALFSSRQAAAADLPAKYWEALKRMQRAEVESLRTGALNTKNPRADDAVTAIRAELIRLEAGRDSAPAPLASGVLATAQRIMEADSALLSFQLGDSVSWMWALDKEGIELYVLPPRKQVEREVEAAACAIRDDSPDASRISANLYHTLFGGLARRFTAKTRWLIALDKGMFDAPVAALTDNFSSVTDGVTDGVNDSVNDSGGREATYVAERHVIEFIPGIGYWAENRARQSAQADAYRSRLFVGVGDPVYNTADPRNATAGNRQAWRPRWFGASAGGAPLVLPRLVASSAEVDGCARAWNGERTLLEGRNASRNRLAEALKQNPAVLHFATHIVESSERPVSALIALSLTARNDMELLPPVEIAHWHTHVGLVVLSGCHSAAGAALPGTGLVGLTRAWLLAGAQSVITSNWDVPDESGALFRSLYMNLGGQLRPDPARALRDAQLEMIHAGGWRARPRYWGAYSVVGDI